MIRRLGYKFLGLHRVRLATVRNIANHCKNVKFKMQRFSVLSNRVYADVNKWKPKGKLKGNFINQKKGSSKNVQWRQKADILLCFLCSSVFFFFVIYDSYLSFFTGSTCITPAFRRLCRYGRCCVVNSLAWVNERWEILYENL